MFKLVFFVNEAPLPLLLVALAFAELEVDSLLIVFEVPVLVHVLVLAHHDGFDVETLILLHELLNLLLLLEDQYVELVQLFLELVFLSVQVRQFLLYPLSLSSRSIQKLFLELINLVFKSLLFLFGLILVVLVDFLLLFLFNPFDLGVQVILLFEECAFLFESFV